MRVKRIYLPQWHRFTTCSAHREQVEKMNNIKVPLNTEAAPRCERVSLKCGCHSQTAHVLNETSLRLLTISLHILFCLPHRNVMKKWFSQQTNCSATLNLRLCSSCFQITPPPPTLLFLSLHFVLICAIRSTGQQSVISTWP